MEQGSKLVLLIFSHQISSQNMCAKDKNLRAAFTTGWMQRPSSVTIMNWMVSFK